MLHRPLSWLSAILVFLILLYLLQGQRLDHNFNFQEVLGIYNKDELPLKKIVAELMMDTTKDDFSMVARIYPPEIEFHLSAIYIDISRPQVILHVPSSNRKLYTPSQSLSIFSCAGALWHQKPVSIDCEIKWRGVLL